MLFLSVLYSFGKLSFHPVLLSFFPQYCYCHLYLDGVSLCCGAVGFIVMNPLYLFAAGGTQWSHELPCVWAWKIFDIGCNQGPEDLMSASRLSESIEVDRRLIAVFFSYCIHIASFQSFSICRSTSSTRFWSDSYPNRSKRLLVLLCWGSNRVDSWGEWDTLTSPVANSFWFSWEMIIDTTGFGGSAGVSGGNELSSEMIVATDGSGFAP